MRGSISMNARGLQCCRNRPAHVVNPHTDKSRINAPAIALMIGTIRTPVVCLLYFSKTFRFPGKSEAFRCPIQLLS